MSDTPEQPGPRIVSIPEALAGGYPILDPLGNRLHYPGEEQYEAWREEYRRPNACIDRANDAEAGDVPY
jgi:hypothetical protein